MAGNMAPLTPAEITTWFDSPGEPEANTFELSLVLGGTVSAGAYTAGVLDFLIQALQDWHASGAAGHKVKIRFLAGTSGGGLNAAIFARAMGYGFPAVSHDTAPGIAAQNPFYDTWVNQLNLARMLQTDDLAAADAKVVSLLDGGAIDDAANKVVAFTGGPARPWLAQPLRLFLTLTNLNGMPYQIQFGEQTMPDGSGVPVQQSYVNHADFARFAVVYAGQLAPADARPDETVLTLGDDAAWANFGQFARATAAFPIGFPARTLARDLDQYRYRITVISSTDANGVTTVTPRPLIPDWGALQDWNGAGGIPWNYVFTCVDGGATDNEPIELARSALGGITKQNPRDGRVAQRAVLLIDPFAGNASMAAPLKNNVAALAGALVTTLTQQTRYDTRDITLAADPDVFSRFMISAYRDGLSGDAALATAGLGAFIGFAYAAFRRHDFLLGRKNCRDFLANSFVLPAENPIFHGLDTGGAAMLPIIPLVGNSAAPQVLDDWPVEVPDPKGLYADAIKRRLDLILNRELPADTTLRPLVLLAGEAGLGLVTDWIVAQMKGALPKAAVADV